MVILYSYTVKTTENGQIEQVVVTKENIDNDVAISMSYHCNVCGEFFEAKKRIQEHFKIHTQRKTNACKICSNSFWTKKGLNNHSDSHIKSEKKKSKERYSCLLCDYSTLKGSSFENHVVKLNCFKFKCKLCDFQTSYQKGLIAHNLVEHNDIEKIFKCKACDFQARRWNKLKLHVEAKHTNCNAISTDYPCSKCDVVGASLHGYQDSRSISYHKTLL